MKRNLLLMASMALMCSSATLASSLSALEGSKPARSVSIQAKLDWIAAPIKSKEDLQRYLQTVPESMSPLGKLSHGARGRFLADLVFNQNGLVSYNYSALVDELNASDALQVMALFGAQRTVPLIKDLRKDSMDDLEIMSRMMEPPDDHEGFQCIGANNCSTFPDMICMTGC